VIKPIVKTKGSDVKSLSEAILKFLDDVTVEDWPELGCLGIAGPVENNRVTLTNMPGWTICDGK